jgi:hypothetical protein
MKRPAGDPRKAETLEQACANGDGTFNGFRLLSWLSDVTNPGQGLSIEEVEQLAERKGIRGKSR